MSVQTLETITAPVDTPLDHDAAEALGDDILLASAGSSRAKKVSGRITATQSHQARAWTTSGSVD